VRVVSWAGHIARCGPAFPKLGGKCDRPHTTYKVDKFAAPPPLSRGPGLSVQGVVSPTLGLAPAATLGRSAAVRPQLAPFGETRRGEGGARPRGRLARAGEARGRSHGIRGQSKVTRNRGGAASKRPGESFRAEKDTLPHRARTGRCLEARVAHRAADRPHRSPNKRAYSPARWVPTEAAARASLRLLMRHGVSGSSQAPPPSTFVAAQGRHRRPKRSSKPGKSRRKWCDRVWPWAGRAQSPPVASVPQQRTTGWRFNDKRLAGAHPRHATRQPPEDDSLTANATLTAAAGPDVFIHGLQDGQGQQTHTPTPPSRAAYR